MLYADETGLYDLAMLVKKYVKGSFGTDSSQYNQIKGLEFTRGDDCAAQRLGRYYGGRFECEACRFWF